MHHHQVIRQDARAQHGLAPDPQGKIFPVPSAGIKGQVILDAFLGQDGRSGGHIAHNGHLIFGRLAFRRLAFRRLALPGRLRQRQGPALAGLLADDSQLLQMLQVKMHRGRGFQSHGLADLPHRGGIPLVLNGLGDVVVDLLLHFGQLGHDVRSFTGYFLHYIILKSGLQQMFDDFFISFPPPL